MPIKNWSTTPANNNAAPPNGWPEYMLASKVNDTARQQMADHKTQWLEGEWFDHGDIPSRASNTTFKIPTDVTTEYAAHRRLKCFDTTTLYATIISSSYSAPDTTVTVVTDTGNLSASLSSVALALLRPSSISVPSTIGRKGADIASATTTDIGAASGDFVDVTGTTTITGLGTITAGVERTVRFTGALTLTHNSTSLILPGGASITTAANDGAVFRSLGSGNWLCVAYQRASGQALLGSETFDISGLSADATPDSANDYLLSYDTSATAPKKVLMNNLPKTTTHFDISGLSADATPDVSNDYMLTYDTSATAPKKVLLNNIPKTTTHFDFSGLSADASPDNSADYILSYDDSATAPKKVLINNFPKTSTHFDFSGLSADATPVGSTDYVLSYDDSASAPKKVLMNNLPSGATGAMTLISSATASASSSITFTGLSSTYSSYIVFFIAVIPATDNVDFYFRTSTNNGSSYDSGASDYLWAHNGAGAQNATSNSTGDTAINLTGTDVNQDLDSSGLYTGYINIYRPSAADRCLVEWCAAKTEANTSMITQRGCGARNTAADVDAIQFLTSSGNITSGTFKLYGIIA